MSVNKDNIGKYITQLVHPPRQLVRYNQNSVNNFLWKLLGSIVTFESDCCELTDSALKIVPSNIVGKSNYFNKHYKRSKICERDMRYQMA